MRCLLQFDDYRSPRQGKLHRVGLTVSPVNFARFHLTALGLSSLRGGYVFEGSDRVYEVQRMSVQTGLRPFFHVQLDNADPVVLEQDFRELGGGFGDVLWHKTACGQDDLSPFRLAWSEGEDGPPYSVCRLHMP